MNIEINELMVSQVMTASPRQSVASVRKVMTEHGVKSMPVVDEDQHPVGIVTATDLLGDVDEARPVREIMTEDVFTVPRYGDPSLAARIMRNHKVHHVVVTHEQKIVGILSSFDLLRLIEDKRFVMKNAPTTPKRGGAGRRKTEA